MLYVDLICTVCQYGIILYKVNKKLLTLLSMACGVQVIKYVYVSSAAAVGVASGWFYGPSDYTIALELWKWKDQLWCHIDCAMRYI